MQSNINLQKRNPYWDNFKGILIILVVFAHYLWAYRYQPVSNTLVRYIYMFHMPAFIFVSDI